MTDFLSLFPQGEAYLTNFGKKIFLFALLRAFALFDSKNLFIRQHCIFKYTSSKKNKEKCKPKQLFNTFDNFV